VSSLGSKRCGRSAAIFARAATHDAVHSVARLGHRVAEHLGGIEPLQRERHARRLVAAESAVGTLRAVDEPRRVSHLVVRRGLCTR
jgi:hypothetical protein